MNEKISILYFIMDSHANRSQLNGSEGVLFAEILENFAWKKKTDHEKQQARKSFVEAYKNGHPTETLLSFEDHFVRAYDALERIYQDTLFFNKNDVLEIKDVRTLKSIAVLLIEKDNMNESFFGGLQHLTPFFMQEIMLSLKEVYPQLGVEIDYFINIYKVMYESWPNKPVFLAKTTNDNEAEASG